MKRILVPTDFSPTSERALYFAANIVSKTEGTVILYHTYVPLESSFIAAESQREKYNTETEETIIKRLQRLKNKVLDDTMNVSVSTIVGRAPLINNLLELAEQSQIDLIVMGTQGASGLKKIIMGSVAARVIEKSKLPVLLIPEKFEWKEPEQIVFTTNFSKEDNKALDLIGSFAALYQAEISVLHLLHINADAEYNENEKKEFDAYARKIQKELNHYNLSFHILEVESAIEAMESLEKRFPYDTMVMVRRQKTLLEKIILNSFTTKMAYITTKPLLIVPESSGR